MSPIASASQTAQRRRAFTLVELIAAVMIVAMLVVLIGPLADHARATARTVDCQANLKLFGVAHHMYANLQKDYFPPHRRGGTKSPWYTNELFRSLMHIGSEHTTTRFPERLLCAARPVEKGPHINRSYGQNASNLPPVIEPDGEAQYILRSSIKDPAERVAMSDANDWRVSMGGAEHAKKWDVTRELQGSPAEKGSYQVVAYRHNETANVIHFDGSVRNYQKHELWIKDAADKVNTLATRKKWWLQGDETYFPPPKPKDAPAAPKDASPPANSTTPSKDAPAANPRKA